MTHIPPPGFHLPHRGFVHFGHFMPQVDINALHYLASSLWVRRGQKLVIAEVGSFTGASSLALANYAERLYCIDTWTGGDDPADGINEIYARKGSRGVTLAFLSNVDHYTKNGVIKPIKCTSLEAATDLANCRSGLDMVFLDACHDCEHVRDDIAAWKPLVRKGGILAGHDYGDLFPGVKQAVEEAFPGLNGPGFGLETGSQFDVIGNVWWKEIT